MLIVGLFILSISSWFSLGRLSFSKELSFSSRLSILLPYSCFIIVSYNPVYFCIVCCKLSFFIPNFVDLILLYFSLMSLATCLSVLFIFSKSQLLVLLIFTTVSFISFSSISDQIFIIFFLLLVLGFSSSFSSCFRCKVRLPIQCFSCFLR